MRAPFGIFLIIVFAFLTSFAQVEKSIISVKSWVDRATITIGDRIIYTLLIKADPDLKIEPISSGKNLGAFEVKDFKAFPPEKDKKGEIIYKYECNITIFNTGDYVIPKVEVAYTDSKGKKKKIFSDRLFITVKSVGAGQDEMSDIRDIKPPMDIKTGYRIYYAIFFGLLLFLGALLLYLRTKSKALKIPEIEKLKIPAWELAYKELEALKYSNLLKEERIKDYFIILSDIIKKYLQQRFSFSALDKTTVEIKRKLKEIKVKAKHTELIHSFFCFCDLVKFAKYKPPSKEIQKAFEDAKIIVDETLPKEKLFLKKEAVV